MKLSPFFPGLVCLLGSFLFSGQGLRAQTQTMLVSVDFHAGASTTKSGFAAVGHTANDYWNGYTRDGAEGWRTFGGLANLKTVEGIQTGAGLTIANAPGAWGNGSTDPMYNVSVPFRPGRCAHYADQPSWREL